MALYFKLFFVFLFFTFFILGSEPAHAPAQFGAGVASLDVTVKGVFNTELQYFAAIQDTDGTVYADIHATDVEPDAVTFPVPELLPVQYPEEIEMFIGAYCRIDGVTLSVLKVPADGQVMLFSHADAFGSPVAMTNMNGDVVWERQYFPYGGEVASETFDDEIASVPINFTSHYKDDETGLVYMGARYYDTAGRRFITPDPQLKGAALLERAHTSQDWNPYIYARSNPYKFTDPTGQHPLGIVAVAAGAYVALETGVDVSLTVYDGYHYVRAVSEGDADAAESLGWDLTMDIGGAISPAIPAGAINKVVKYGIELYDGIEFSGDVYTLLEQGDSSPAVSFAVGAVAQEFARQDRTYQTYTKVNPETGQVYCGRTSGCGTPEENVRRRDKSHHLNKEGFERAKLDRSSKNADAIRGREQILINRHGGAQSRGGTAANKINAISERNPNRERYLRAAKKLFR